MRGRGIIFILGLVGLSLLGYFTLSSRENTKTGRAQKAESARTHNCPACSDADVEHNSNADRAAHRGEQRRTGALVQGELARQVKRRILDYVEESAQEESGENTPVNRSWVDEAADWEKMSDEEREDVGLTRLALYASRNAARWAFSARLLEQLGAEDLAERAQALNLELLTAAQPRSGRSTEDFFSREAALLDEVRALGFPRDTEAGARLHQYVDEIGRNIHLERSGQGSPVDDKIARERESALLRENARTPDDSDDAEKRRPE